jgi:hypothetical protein
VFIRSIFIALFTIASANATTLTIDKINISTVAGYGDTHYPGSAFDRFSILGAAYSYELSDGQIRASGAGWIPYTNGTISAISVNNGIVNYEFGSVNNWAKGAGTIFYSIGQVWCPSCNEPGTGLWTEAQLAPVSPIVLSAKLGSNTATLTGTAKIVASDPNSWGGGVANFIGLSSPVGAVVTYSATYTLTDGSTWDVGAFGRQFDYNVFGAIQLAPVPEPSTAALLALGIICGMTLKRKKLAD